MYKELLIEKQVAFCPNFDGGKYAVYIIHLFLFYSLRVNQKFSVMSGRVFLG